MPRYTLLGRTQGFCRITSNSEVVWEDNAGQQQLTAISENPTPSVFCPHFCAYPLIRPSLTDTIAYSCTSEVTSEEGVIFWKSFDRIPTHAADYPLSLDADFHGAARPVAFNCELTDRSSRSKPSDKRLTRSGKLAICLRSRVQKPMPFERGHDHG